MPTESTMIDVAVKLIYVGAGVVILYLVVKYAVRAGVVLALRQFEQEGGNLARLQQPSTPYQYPSPPAAYPTPRNFNIVDDTPNG